MSLDRFVVEQTIHVREDRWGHGIGRAPVAELLVRAGRLGKTAIVAAVDGANDASVQLHRSLGYVEVGRMPRTGFTFGRRLDLVLLQRNITVSCPEWRTSSDQHSTGETTCLVSSDSSPRRTVKVTSPQNGPDQPRSHPTSVSAHLGPLGDATVIHRAERARSPTIGACGGTGRVATG